LEYANWALTTFRISHCPVAMYQTIHSTGDMQTPYSGSTPRPFYFLVGDYHRVTMDNKAPDVDANF
jgi:hypothetical protein